MEARKWLRLENRRGFCSLSYSILILNSRSFLLKLLHARCYVMIFYNTYRLDSPDLLHKFIVIFSKNLILIFLKKEFFISSFVSFTPSSSPSFYTWLVFIDFGHRHRTSHILHGSNYSTSSLEIAFLTVTPIRLGFLSLILSHSSVSIWRKIIR